MNKRKLSAIILMIIVLLMSGCNNSTNYSHNTQDSGSSIQNTLEFLTSDVCDGRMTGTKGNEEAQKYLVEALRNYNIEPYQNDYYHEFIYEDVKVSEINLELGGKEFINEEDIFIFAK